MEGFSVRLKELMAKKRISYQALGSVIGVSGQAVHKWANGGGISPDNVKAIAAYFKVSPSILFFGEEAVLPKQENELLIKFRGMDHDAKRSVIEFIDYHADLSKKRLPIGEPETQN